MGVKKNNERPGKSAETMEGQEVLEPLARSWEGKTAHNAYPEEVREAAVTLAIELRSVKQAAKRLNIPLSTLTAWMAEAMVIDLDAWNLSAVKEIVP